MGLGGIIYLQLQTNGKHKQRTEEISKRKHPCPTHPPTDFSHPLTLDLLHFVYRNRSSNRETAGALLRAMPRPTSEPQRELKSESGIEKGGPLGSAKLVFGGRYNLLRIKTPPLTHRGHWGFSAL